MTSPLRVPPPNPDAKEWVVETRVTISNHWRLVNDGEQDTLVACQVLMARKQRAYPPPHTEYRIRNVRTNDVVEV
jgi:hypothetical protein